MAPSSSSSQEVVYPWLKALPVAPTYHPTLSEFSDPIAYILKIEPEASRFGICKIVPPLPSPPKKSSLSHLSRSVPSFSTRSQQVGLCPRRPRPVLKPVWQSGSRYSLEDFEVKAKQFERAHLKKLRKKPSLSSLSPLEIETMFWDAFADRPFAVEYANDMAGSGFPPIGGRRKRVEEAADVGETMWNMRGVSRSEGSLLRFMKEEIPGVTSPMVYVAMLFSWFAWHVEDHELHSLNYLHFGAGKTWYGVPRDARLAFEDVVRVHGYGAEVNPLVTFATLGEKTTVMSPEVFVNAGIPCCRLVQNAGEFVVTFPGAYHSGFSHGFNFGEASNIATPRWLKVAKEAAIRRASTNCPPMVSHFQLLYALALALHSRMPTGATIEPRSSRLKYKMRGEGELMVKEEFVKNVIQNSDLLGILLDKGSSCIILPRITSDSSCSSALIKTQIKVKPRLSLGLYSHQETVEASGNLLSDGIMLDRKTGAGYSNDHCSINRNSIFVYQRRNNLSGQGSKYEGADLKPSTSTFQNVEVDKQCAPKEDGLLDQGLLSCVTCGILSFSCVAVVQPREAAISYLTSADYYSLNHNIAYPGEISNIDVDDKPNQTVDDFEVVCGSDTLQAQRYNQERADDYLEHGGKHSTQVSDMLDTEAHQNISALDLLASAYEDLSDSEAEELQQEIPVHSDGRSSRDISPKCDPNNKSHFGSSPEKVCSSELPLGETDCLIGDAPNGALDASPCPLDRFLTTHEMCGQHSSFASGSPELGLTNDRTEVSSPSQAELSSRNCPDYLEYGDLNSSENEHREMAASSWLAKSIGRPDSIDSRCRDIHGNCRSMGAVSGHWCKEFRNPGSSLAHSPTRPEFSVTPTGNANITEQSIGTGASIEKSTISVLQNSEKDSSRMHVFCLQHAVEVEKQLQPMGGVHVMLLCHPDYPRMEVQAKLLAAELGIDYVWKEISFREATEKDQERIQTAMEDEEAIPTSSDWTVKLGINLYHSASLSKSPLYSKQMPFNAVIYKSFGCELPGRSPVKPKGSGRRPGRKKKIVVAGKWCGKVWMSNQVHPYLAHISDTQELEEADKLHCQSVNQKHKGERKVGISVGAVLPKNDSSGTCPITSKKSGKKRKKPLGNSTFKKERDTQAGNSDVIPDTDENSAEDCGRILRSRSSKCKKTNVQHKSDEAEEKPIAHLRKRKSRTPTVEIKSAIVKGIRKKSKKVKASDLATKDEVLEYPCDIEGCSMSFGTKQDLSSHKRNICPLKGCGKKFFSHKYLVQHRKVHLDDRPLKCPWKGCKMSFKWPWARTEHIRVHTGARPYVCMEAGCGQTFRFVSDFSRHKRKTGHSKRKNKK